MHSPDARLWLVRGVGQRMTCTTSPKQLARHRDSHSTRPPPHRHSRRGGRGAGSVPPWEKPFDRLLIVDRLVEGVRLRPCIRRTPGRVPTSYRHHPLGTQALRRGTAKARRATKEMVATVSTWPPGTGVWLRAEPRMRVLLVSAGTPRPNMRSRWFDRSQEAGVRSVRRTSSRYGPSPATVLERNRAHATVEARGPLPNSEGAQGARAVSGRHLDFVAAPRLEHELAGQCDRSRSGASHQPADAPMAGMGGAPVKL